MAALDDAYHEARRRLTDQTAAQARALFRAGFEERRDTVDEIAALVADAQAHMVELVNTYFAAKMGVEPQDLDTEKYTTEALRGVPAWQVYGRAWGTAYAVDTEVRHGTGSASDDGSGGSANSDHRD